MDTESITNGREKSPECKNPQIGEQLAAYELGWLSSSEAVQFERHLQECQVCWGDMQHMAPVWSILQKNPKIMDDLEVGVEPATGSAWKWLHQSGRQVAMLVSLLVMVGLVIYLRPPDDKSHWLSNETVHLRQPADNAFLAEGLRALRAGDFRAAKVRFQKAVRERPRNYEANYLLGLLLLKESEREPLAGPEKLNGAIKHLIDAKNISEGWENPIFEGQACYYLARAYLSQKNPTMSLELLQRIEHLSGNDSDLFLLKQRAADLRILCRS